MTKVGGIAADGLGASLVIGARGGDHVTFGWLAERPDVERLVFFGFELPGFGPGAWRRAVPECSASEHFSHPFAPTARNVAAQCNTIAPSYVEPPRCANSEPGFILLRLAMCAQ
jgi:hypothetical protein